MKLLLKRHEPGITCTIGKLWVDGEPFCDTLEDLPHETKIAGDTRIPAGIYEVTLSESAAVKAGKLWSPCNGLLPLLHDVPDFDGVRIHAGNTDRDTRGCVLVGHWVGGEYVSGSRPVLTALMEKLIDAESIELEITDT